MTKDELLKLIFEAAKDGRSNLVLHDQEIDELAPEIRKLVNLRCLYLGGNRLTDLPAEIGELVNLESLSLNGNRLTRLPDEIRNLVKLRYLYISRNQLEALPGEISKLVDLETLYLYGNQLTALPSEIKNLINLTSLMLDGNEISVFPKEIAQLRNLTNLYIDEKQLRNWAEYILGLKSVRLNVLRGHAYEIVTSEILATFESGQELIEYYFKSQAIEGKALNEAKVIIIGQGNVGKTSLRQRLTGESYENTGRTEGVEIVNWKTKVTNNRREVLELKLNIWDFGGQEIYHTTHQFFFRSRCLYILVVDARLGADESRLHYWLRQAEAFGKSAPVLVVLNKAEEKETESIDKRYEKVRETVLTLRKTFPNIFDCILVSCERSLEIDKVKQGIATAISEKMSEVFSAIPGKWFEIKEKLEELNDNYLAETKFEELCAEIPTDEREQLTAILDALGIIVSFEDRDLSDTKVIKPEWITKGIYKILSSYVLAEENGRVSPEKIYGMFAGEDDYPPDKVEYILRLMEKYDLCCRESGEPFLLFPVAFPVQERKHQQLGKNTTHFEYQYTNEYYDSIIVRFLKEAYEKYGTDFYYWRKGLVGRLNGHQIYIRADDISNRIEIKIDGTEGGRRDLLEGITEIIDRIHSDFAKLEVEKVLMHPKKKQEFPFEKVINRLDGGRSTVDYLDDDGDAVKVPIDYVLEGIAGKEIKEEEVSEEVKRLENAFGELKSTHDEVLQELSLAVTASEKIKTGLDSEAEKITRLYAVGSFLVITILLLSWIGMIVRVGWETMEMWTYIAGIFFGIGAYGFAAFTLSEFNPTKFFERKKEKNKKSLYEEFGFDIEAHEARKQRLKSLQKPLQLDS